MSKTEASVYIVGCICFAVIVSVFVKSCSDNTSQMRISDNSLRLQQFQGQREDCNKTGGILVQSWGEWECKK